MAESRGRKEERRRRNAIETVGKRLAVNASALDFSKFKYRWINDDPARIFQMTKQDDWDVVTPEGEVIKDDSTDLGNAVSVVVGQDPNSGAARRAYLCRKRNEWYEEDQKQKQTELDEQLEQIRRGKDAAGGSQSDYVPGQDTPGEAIKIA